MDKSVVSYTNWDSSQPDNNGNTEDCVEAKEQNMKWDDIKCTTSNGYICKFQPRKCLNNTQNCFICKFQASV